MGITTDLDIVRRTIQHLTEQVVLEKYQWPVEKRATFEIAVLRLGEVLLEQLDTGAFQDPPDKSVVDAAMAFCWSRCPNGQDETPGGHPLCVQCELHPYTILPLREVAKPDRGADEE